MERRLKKTTETLTVMSEIKKAWWLGKPTEENVSRRRK